MSAQTKIFISKLSIPGKANDELSYVFTDRIGMGDDTPVIFGMFHFFETADVYHSLIKETVKNFVDFFHRSQNSLSADFDSSVDSSEFLFENAIQYTSEHVTQFLLSEHESGLRPRQFDIRRVSLVLGALFGDSLFLSMTGSSIAPMYIYPVFRKEGFSHYSVLNIGGDDSDAQSQRLFSNVFSGKLSIEGSTFVMCNHHFLDYISLDQIKQAVTNMSIQNLSGYFEGLLGKVHGKNDFSAIFINPHYTGPLPKGSRERMSSATNRSMAGLNSTASGTTTILSPGIGTHLRPAIARVQAVLLRALTALLRWITTAAQFSFDAVRAAFREKKINPHAIAQWARQAPVAVAHLVSSGVLFAQKLLKAETRASVLRTASLGVREAIARTRETVFASFTSLNRASKAILALGFIFLLLFVNSVISIRAKQVAEKDLLSFQEAARTIELKTDLAEASLLYDNGDKAQTIIADAKQLLASLSHEKLERQERYDQLVNRLNILSGKISKVTLLPNPRKFASLENQIPNASSARLLHTGDMLIAYTPDSLYTIDKKGAAHLVDTQAKVPSIHCASPLSHRYVAVCVGDANKLGIVDLKEKTAKMVSVDFHDREKAIQSIAIYANRLYVLDSASGMVYRHQKNGDGFDAGIAWIKETADITSASDFALDGTVFVLASPTTVRQFAAGKSVPFSIPLIDPPVAALTRIVTSDESPLLLLLEPANKRIIVVEKKSMQLKSQLVSDTFSDLHDFVTTKKDIYLLNGTDIYKIPMP
ncbi:hypothetical protein HY627_01250 [Candidatus Uhrbacteria bacterium]|nr:hypothetical protein [Candidatus Uhrbacteria bacterium]